jgi:hypothetical protein
LDVLADVSLEHQPAGQTGLAVGPGDAWDVCRRRRTAAAVQAESQLRATRVIRITL